MAVQLHGCANYVGVWSFYIFSSGGSVDERLIGDLQAERGE